MGSHGPLARAFGVALAVMMVAVACGSDDSDQSSGSTSDGSESGASTSADPTDPPTNSSTAPSTSAPSTTEPREVRLDPLPARPTIDETTDVVISMLGPSDDVSAQARRIDPTFPDVPAPADATIIDARTSGPALVSTVIIYQTAEPVDTLVDELKAAVVAANPDWVEEPPTRSVAADGAFGFDLPEIQQSEQLNNPDLEMTFHRESDGGSTVWIKLLAETDDPAVVERFGGWTDELPVPAGGQITNAQVTADAEDRLVTYRMTATLPVADEDWGPYARFLEERGLSTDPTVVEADLNEELLVSGNNRFDELTIERCCNEIANRLIKVVGRIEF